MNDTTPRDEDGAKADQKDSEYRDDASEFAASSDYAQSGTTGRYSGGGPGEADDRSAGRHGEGNNRGSQEEWRGGGTASANDDVDTGEGRTEEAYGDVPSRSADPGQSSYGGFKDEGHAEHDALQQKASDRKRDDDDTEGASDETGRP